MQKFVLAKDAFYRFKQYFKIALATMIIVAFTKIFIFDFYWIPTVSMEPNLLKGDHVIAFKFLPASRGDVVAVKLPDDPYPYIKRIIALPDETVDIKAGDLIVNNKKVKKTYDVDVKKYKYIESDNIVLKEYADKRSYSIMQSNVERIPDFVKPYKNIGNSVFLLGDNRSNSIDSRNWGSVDKKKIKSVIGLIWLSIDPDTHKIRWNRIGKMVN